MKFSKELVNIVLFYYLLLSLVTKNAKQGSQHWMVERIVAVGLLAAVPAGIFYPAPIIDHSLAVLLPLHAYW